MKFSEKWLREWVNPAVSTDELAEQLTLLGLEVDDIEYPAELGDKVVVARIVSIEKHPDADKLRVCQVDAGSEQAQIVCGAANAAEGLVVPLALPGAKLPGGIKIRIPDHYGGTATRLAPHRVCKPDTLDQPYPSGGHMGDCGDIPGRPGAALAMGRGIINHVRSTVFPSGIPGHISILSADGCGPLWEPVHLVALVHA